MSNSSSSSLTEYVPPTQERPQSLSLTLSEIETYATIFAKSGYFQDAQQLAQAAVKIIFGQEYGLSPGQAMSSISIIAGKPSLSAQAMAGLAKRAGYTLKVLEHTEKLCSIMFYDRYGQECGPASVFTAEDARRAGTKNMDKFPKNMLYARAVSNGCRWYCSDVFTGPIYTPEEMAQIPEETRFSAPVVVEQPLPPVQQPQEEKPAEEKQAEEKPANGSGLADRRRSVALAFIGAHDERVIPQIIGRDFSPPRMNKKTGEEILDSLNATFAHMSAEDLDAVEAYMADGTLPELEMAEA